MNFGALIQSILYLISSSLLYPAMVVLLAAFVGLVISFGSFIAEWGERARLRKPASEDWPAILKGRRRLDHYLGATLDNLDALLNGEKVGWREVERLFQEVSDYYRKKLNFLRILVRLGPSTGLIATLIPMSTGLAGLSQGDMSRLSSDLVVAFTATIVGLAVGVTAFVLHAVRSSWLESDLETLELVVLSRTEEKLGPKSSS
ncbi:MAG: MotA/TolQ/ExbB proton channel family protein [Deltaproteobacteria bacterium]|jgi:biopolymer transport protein ExbB/TolQ|nr:MotA/TolQ/ExbB proton channel family protein [Deltaproteobacteria bacterium]